MIERAFFTVLSGDLAVSRDFYVELFGYRPSFESSWFVQLADPKAELLELGILHRDHPVVPQGTGLVPCGGFLTLVVDDVEALHARALALGVPVREPPRDLFYGQRRTVLESPDGLLLDVSSPCAPDPEWMKRVTPTAGGGFRET